MILILEFDNRISSIFINKSCGDGHKDLKGHKADYESELLYLTSVSKIAWFTKLTFPGIAKGKRLLPPILLVILCKSFMSSYPPIKTMQRQKALS